MHLPARSLVCLAAAAGGAWEGWIPAAGATGERRSRLIVSGPGEH